MRFDRFLTAVNSKSVQVAAPYVSCASRNYSLCFVGRNEDVDNNNNNNFFFEDMTACVV